MSQNLTMSYSSSVHRCYNSFVTTCLVMWNVRGCLFNSGSLFNVFRLTWLLLALFRCVEIVVPLHPVTLLRHLAQRISWWLVNSLEQLNVSKYRRTVTYQILPWFLLLGVNRIKNEQHLWRAHSCGCRWCSRWELPKEIIQNKTGWAILQIYRALPIDDIEVNLFAEYWQVAGVTKGALDHLFIQLVVKESLRPDPDPVTPGELGTLEPTGTPSAKDWSPPAAM
jgi:hypothetical protein